MKTFNQFMEQVVPKNSSERSPYPNSYSGSFPYIRTKDVLEKGAVDFFSKYFMGPDFKQVKNNKVKDKTKIATHDKRLFKSVPATGPRGDQPASDYLRNAATPGGLIKGSITNPLGLKKA